MGIITSMTMIGPLLLDIARDLRLPLGQASVLAVVSAVPQALSSPFAGLLADRFGRRPMIVLSLTGSGLLALAASIAPSFATLVVHDGDDLPAGVPDAGVHAVGHCRRAGAVDRRARRDRRQRHRKLAR